MNLDYWNFKSDSSLHQVFLIGMSGLYALADAGSISSRFIRISNRYWNLSNKIMPETNQFHEL
jgi:hypothetical protein